MEQKFVPWMRVAKRIEMKEVGTFLSKSYSLDLPVQCWLAKLNNYNWVARFESKFGHQVTCREALF